MTDTCYTEDHLRAFMLSGTGYRWRTGEARGVPVEEQITVSYPTEDAWKRGLQDAACLVHHGWELLLLKDPFEPFSITVVFK